MRKFSTIVWVVLLLVAIGSFGEALREGLTPTKIATWCGVLEPSEQEFSQAALKALGPKLLFCRGHDCDAEIARLRAWASTVSDPAVRAQYEHWLDFTEWEARRAKAGEPIDDDARRRRVDAIAQCLPMPPSD